LKGIHKITLFLLAVLVFAACSRKKSTFLSRNYHAVTAEYNTLFNGNVAFDQGKEELALGYQDNFWEILPVERVDLKEKQGAPGQELNPNFNRAEEKGAKAIQKHSIYVDGKEHNPQIDEAYMLLGKARYYDQRFVAAQDAFNFILNRYPTSNNINRAKVWKAKTNIRMRNEELALENLQEMLDEVALDEEELADATAIMAQAYINLDSIAEALPYIKMASAYVDDNELKGRYAYIKGQVYDRLEMRDSANMAFDEVIELNRKSPRIYMINAYIEKARNFDYDNEDRTAFLELLYELEADRENRPYLDKIYNQIGEYYRNVDSIDTAIRFYNKSIKNFKNDRFMQAVNYRTLAEISFDRALYKNAGAYYDSTLSQLEANSREWRRITKKREKLDDVIKYEDIATTNDSIIRIANMSESERLTYFTDYTERLKAKAIADSIENAKQQEAFANNEFYKKTNKIIPGASEGTFYFYNPTTVAYGKQEFEKIWGDRRLQDNWRLSSIQNSSLEDDIVAEAGVPISENEKFDPQTYLATIPTDRVVLDSLAKDRNFAYYQLGLIYKEQFREYGLSADRLETLLAYNPEERLVLPAKYNLHKVYLELGNEPLAEQYKNDIITNHPNTRYAQILLNPNTLLGEDESSPEFKYKQLYKDFEASKYQYVIDQSDMYINQYNGTEIVPKFELLKATAIARQHGFEPYKKALNFIALNYPNFEEGKQAEEIYKTVLPGLEFSAFEPEEEAKKFKLVYPFDVAEAEEANKLIEKLTEAVKAYGYRDMDISLDYYTPQTRFAIVHGFNTKTGARQFGEALKENKEFKIKRPHFEIATPNYKIIQIHKNLDAYQNQGGIDPANSNPQK
jgi:tetratricopeptide (TPR) repeat protein